VGRKLRVKGGKTASQKRGEGNIEHGAERNYDRHEEHFVVPCIRKGEESIQVFGKRGRKGGLGKDWKMITFLGKGTVRRRGAVGKSIFGDKNRTRGDWIRLAKKGPNA